MRDFRKTNDDQGGVHTNSNIHNKAAYLVLTAQDARGRGVFTADEVAILSRKGKKAPKRGPKGRPPRR